MTGTVIKRQLESEADVGRQTKVARTKEVLHSVDQSGKGYNNCAKTWAEWTKDIEDPQQYLHSLLNKMEKSYAALGLNDPAVRARYGLN